MSEELNISTALNDIYEAAIGIKVLGNVVDRNENGDIPFSTVGTGNLILELAEKIDQARKALEEDYHLGDHEDEIRVLNEKRLAEIKKTNEAVEAEIKARKAAEKEEEVDHGLPRKDTKSNQAEPDKGRYGIPAGPGRGQASVCPSMRLRPSLTRHMNLRKPFPGCLLWSRISGSKSLRHEA